MAGGANQQPTGRLFRLPEYRMKPVPITTFRANSKFILHYHFFNILLHSAHLDVNIPVN